MTAIRFQADADLKQSIVSGILRRQPNLDFRSAHAACLEGKKDQEVLAIAAKEGRVLVTHDRKTMPVEFGDFVMSQTSSGVLILSQSLSIIALRIKLRTKGKWGRSPQPGVPPLHPALTFFSTAIVMRLRHSS